MIIIPSLPEDVSNKEFLSKANVVMRFFSNIPGNLIEKFISAKHRVYFERKTVRFLCKHFGEAHPVPDHLTVEDKEIGGTPCRLYIPNKETRKSDGALFLVHGGAWLYNRAKYYDETCFDLATQIGCMIISIDYRRAPEVTFPVPVNDCWSAVEGFATQIYKEYGIDKNLLGVIGDSAGGNLAAVMALRDNVRKTNYLKCQILLYPATSCIDVDSPAFHECRAIYKNSVLLQPKQGTRAVLLYLGLPATKRNIRKVMSNACTTMEVRNHPDYIKNFDMNLLPEDILNSRHYIPNVQPSPDPEFAEIFSKAAFQPEFAPLFCSDEEMKGMCNAMVVSVQYDVLRDESILYAKKMERLEVGVEWKHYEKGYHGIFTIKGCELHDQVFGDVVQYVKKQFGMVQIEEEEKTDSLKQFADVVLRETSIETYKEDPRNNDSGFEDGTSSISSSDCQRTIKA
uniref:Abhydrolase_3 domain-containing protein n=1 Tax=Rhabditophanes sp. KR3021 TaxID=114890 RepID=A0AC35TG40_9BILA